MPKLLFVFDNKDEDKWQDGLWQALNRLQENYGYEITKLNLAHPDYNIGSDFDFILGWGGFNSPVDQFIQGKTGRDNVCSLEPMNYKKGLCIGGIINPPIGMEKYDVLFYETEWYRPTINLHPCIVHAFGINEEIFNNRDYDLSEGVTLFDYCTVGAFADWKRQKLLSKKEGRRIAVGDIQKNNMGESMDIVGDLILNGVAVMDMQDQYFIAQLYHLTRTVYIPANVIGGGERAVLEARACGRKVEIEPDNPKLSELLGVPVWDSHYYSQKLDYGIKLAIGGV